MKKAFSFFAVLMIILTAGCEKQTKEKIQSPPPVPLSFTANMTVDFGNIRMTATLAKNSSDDYTVQLLTPEILSPLALNYKNSGCEVTYDGLKFETNLDRFPQTEFGALLTDALADIEQGIDVETMISDDVITYKGNGERGIYTLKANLKTGELLEFSVEGAQLHVVFSEYKEKS